MAMRVQKLKVRRMVRAGETLEGFFPADENEFAILTSTIRGMVAVSD